MHLLKVYGFIQVHRSICRFHFGLNDTIACWQLQGGLHLSQLSPYSSINRPLEVCWNSFNNKSRAWGQMLQDTCALLQGERSVKWLPLLRSKFGQSLKQILGSQAVSVYWTVWIIHMLLPCQFFSSGPSFGITALDVSTVKVSTNEIDIVRNKKWTSRNFICWPKGFLLCNRPGGCTSLNTTQALSLHNITTWYFSYIYNAVNSFV